MSNIGGNYFRLPPLTETRALSRMRPCAATCAVDGAEIRPESGNPGARDKRGRATAQWSGGSRQEGIGGRP